MRVSILLFVLGAWLLQQQSRLPDLNLAWFALPVLGSALYFRNSRAPVAVSLWKLLALCAGFLWAALLAQSRLGSALDPELEGRDLLVTGVVASLPQVNERGIRFEFDVEQDPRVPNHVSLSWYHQRLKDGAIEFAPQVRAGELWQLTVRLRRPHGNANPHGFDYEAWLLERNIRATGYVRESPDNRLAAPEAPGFIYRIERWRENLRERFRRALPEHPLAGVLVALAIGDQHAISPDQWQVFTRTGVNHLMSISGLHVTMVASLAFALVYGSWRRFPRLALALPARSAASLAAALMALAYAALAGFAVPAQRTVYMVFAVALALLLKRAISPSRVLCLALLAVVLIDPWAVLAPGFWLSFGAVAIILYVTAGRLGLSVGGQDLDRTSRFRRNLRLSFLWGRVQWSLTLGLIPLTLALFQQVSLVSPVANAVAIPVVSLVVVPLTLLAAIPVLEFLLYPAHAIMLWCFEFLEWLSRLPDAVWQQHAPPVWAIAAGLAGAAWMLAPRGFPARWVGAVALLPLFVAPLASPKPGEVWLTVLDVGQGLSVLARTAHHALLYDAGPEFSPGADAGNRIIVPYLRGSGVLRLDGAILTHNDLDHTGGAGSVLQAIPTAWLAASFTPRGDASAMRCFAGQTWEWDSVHFEVLHPKWESYDNGKIKDNDRGCVLKITGPHGSVLLAADIEARSEAELIARSGENLQADVLIAPHHGSKTSSSQEFVRRVDPRTVIFSVGYRNRHGHPRPEVVARYQHSGAAIYRSDQHGAIEIRLGEQPRTETYREKRPRYWHDQLSLPFPSIGGGQSETMSVNLTY